MSVLCALHMPATACECGLMLHCLSFVHVLCIATAREACILQDGSCSWGLSFMLLLMFHTLHMRMDVAYCLTLLMYGALPPPGNHACCQIHVHG